MSIDHDNLEEFQDPQSYDVEVEMMSGSDVDLALVEELAHTKGGPLLDLACGTGRVALRLAEQGYQVTGVDISAAMIEWGRHKASQRGISMEWVIADARSFKLEKHFSLIYMLGNSFQLFLTRSDQEAMLERVREHLAPEGYFLFGTRNPSRYNLFEWGNPTRTSTRLLMASRSSSPRTKSMIISRKSSITPFTLCIEIGTNPRKSPGGKRPVLLFAMSFHKRWKPCFSTTALRYSRTMEIGTNKH